MLEFARYEARRRIKGSIYLSIGLAILAAIVIWAFPSFAETMETDFAEAYPEALVQAFRIEEMSSLEGFLAVELYMFGWVILLGLYLAYSAASVIADDVDRSRMDTLLAMPVSRRRIVAEKYAALAVPIVTVNVLIPPVVVGSAWLIGESISIVDVVAVHALSIPYLFACAGIGLLASVVFDRAAVAQRLALGVTFALFLLQSILADTGVDWVGALTPMQYYDPNEILLQGTYDLVGAAVLVGMSLVLIVASQTWFARRDI